MPDLTPSQQAALDRFERLIDRARRAHAKRQKEAVCASQNPSPSPERDAA